jgi:hypothetical protein
MNTHTSVPIHAFGSYLDFETVRYVDVSRTQNSCESYSLSLSRLTPVNGLPRSQKFSRLCAMSGAPGGDRHSIFSERAECWLCRAVFLLHESSSKKPSENVLATPHSLSLLPGYSVTKVITRMPRGRSRMPASALSLRAAVSKMPSTSTLS